MSKSHKKTPVYKDSTRKGPTFKSGKQIANRIIRRKSDIPDGGGYRKAYCSWNISDYMFRMDENELRRAWDGQDPLIRSRFKTYKEAHRWWLRYYHSK